jgi:hypothetical protein
MPFRPWGFCGGRPARSQTCGISVGPDDRRSDDVPCHLGDLADPAARAAPADAAAGRRCRLRGLPESQNWCGLPDGWRLIPPATSAHCPGQAGRFPQDPASPVQVADRIAVAHLAQGGRRSGLTACRGAAPVCSQLSPAVTGKEPAPPQVLLSYLPVNRAACDAADPLPRPQKHPSQRRVTTPGRNARAVSTAGAVRAARAVHHQAHRRGPRPRSSSDAAAGTAKPGAPAAPVATSTGAGLSGTMPAAAPAA